MVITPLEILNGSFSLVCVIVSILIFVRMARRKKSRNQEKSIKEKSDVIEFLEKLTKHKKNPLTEKEITFYKERKICLVCKKKPLRFIYICPDCDAIYCIMCVNMLINLENACWICKSPFDPSKPVHPIEFKDEDIIVETDETKKKPEKCIAKKSF